MRDQHSSSFSLGRWTLVAIILGLVFLGIISRVIYLTVIDRAFLKQQGNARSLRVISSAAYRGMMVDREGRPLAISTPVDSVWVNPQDFPHTSNVITQVSAILSLPPDVLLRALQKDKTKQFVYIKRGVPPAQAQKIQALSIPGIYLQHTYRRYYPDGAVSAHVIGFTNVDNQGQEGLELEYNALVSGVPSKTLVEQDRYGHTIAVLKELQAEKPGHTLTLSLDQRIQYLSYQTALATQTQFHAESVSVVVLDIQSGEIIAMTNVPSYNPNTRMGNSAQRRNRAVTDVFEPGSVMKTFAIVNALDSKKYTPTSIINTSPGHMKVGRNIVRDDEGHNYGVLTLTGILQKSSNVGITKVTLSLPPDQLWKVLHRVGFGQLSGSGFPGEQAGSLVHHKRWAQISLATLAFGYGVSANALQIARAYAVIANDGLLRPVTFLKQDKSVPGVPVLNAETAHETLTMLQSVLEKEGTGLSARVPGYHIAGKTGTARIAIRGGYSPTHHIGSFVGIAPASHPRFVVAVVVRDPHGLYHGGSVAAPAFATIMGGVLRIYNIPPDDAGSLPAQKAAHDSTKRTTQKKFRD